MSHYRFARLEDRVDRAVSQHLSNVLAVYEQAGAGQLRDVPAIFSEEAEYLEGGAVATKVPYLDLLRADVPAIGPHDYFTFLGNRYGVDHVVPAGGGRVVVQLKGPY